MYVPCNLGSAQSQDCVAHSQNPEIAGAKGKYKKEAPYTDCGRERRGGGVVWRHAPRKV